MSTIRNNNSLYYRSKYLNYAFFTFDDLNNFAKDWNALDVLLGKSEDAVASIVYYPFDLTISSVVDIDVVNRFNRKDFAINGKILDTVDAYDPPAYNKLYFIAKHNPFNRFEDQNMWQLFDPYTSLEIYLPYYGAINIPTKDLYLKTNQSFSPICVFLSVDYPTGEACYIIAADDTNSIPYSDKTVFVGGSYNPRIISTYPFTLGTIIPVGSNIMPDLVRNGILGAVNIASTYGAYSTAISNGFGVTTKTTHGTITTKKPKGKTGGYTVSKLTTKDDTTYLDKTGILQERMLTDTSRATMSALENMQAKPETGRPNNSNILGVLSHNVIFILKTVTLKPATEEEYGLMNGFPLGEYKMLGELSGYTEVSEVHIEGPQFELATQEELNMLEEALRSGIIL